MVRKFVMEAEDLYCQMNPWGEVEGVSKANHDPDFDLA
jgi:hypothetical protein